MLMMSKMMCESQKLHSPILILEGGKPRDVWGRKCDFVLAITPYKLPCQL